MGEFSINGVAIKNPSAFKIERYNITTMNRLANGNMSGDLVAKKMKFYFTYDAITAEELEQILTAIWDTESIFFDLIYPYNGTTHMKTVYSGSIPSELVRAGKTANWVWRGVIFNLIER